jgi:hypothetical protein
MRILRLVAPVLLLAVLGTQTADAQNRRQGFWISGGIGAGVDNTSDQGGGAGYLRLGGTLGKVLLGGETSVWTRSENGANLLRNNTMFTAMVYPSLVGGFFIKGGLGFSVIKVSVDIGGFSGSVTDQGFGSVLGLGYDIALGPKVSLTPNVDLMTQTWDPGSGSTTQTMFLFTIGITGH